MERLTVYRVETSDGYGCYRLLDATSALQFKMAGKHQNRDTHPNIWWDFNENIQLLTCNDENQMRSGFASMQDMFKWFGNFLPELIKTGLFKVYKYHVPAENVFVSNSKKQILFKRDMSERLLK